MAISIPETRERKKEGRVLVSSRRLAREWALRILYQIDVGKHAPQEALASALDSLRREFVQRGSRTASGSDAEAVWLEWVTDNLRDILPGLRLPMERAVSQAAGRICEELPYWQEVRLEVSFRSQMPGTALEPARLLAPLVEKALFPHEPDETDGLTVQLQRLEKDEMLRYRRFINAAREALPPLMEKQMKREALRFARELKENRPVGSTGIALQTYLLEARMEYNRKAMERWHKIGAVTAKQAGDWLRTGAFAYKLVQGVLEKRREIDAEIAALSSGWSLDRQVAVDRNIMRIAGYEMLFLPGIPTGPTINEAVELAKKYSTSESGKFVNGVLGALAAKVGDKLTPPATPAVQDAIESDKDEIVDVPDIEDVEDETE